MAWALVGHVAASSLNGQSVSTHDVEDIDTTGATLITIATALATFLIPPQDSKGNVYTPKPNYAGPLAATRLWECVNPIVGAGHNFSIPPGNIAFPAIAVLAFSGNASSPADQQNGAPTFNPALANPGAVVPTQAGELIITAAVCDNGVPSSVDSGFTPSDLVNFSSQGLGIGMAWTVQNPAAPINPTWRGTGLQSSAIASYKGAVVPPPPTPLVALSLNSVVSVPGGTVTLTLSIASTGGYQCTAIEFALNFNTSDLTLVTVAPGTSATAASKVLNRSGPLCIIGGFNNNVIGDGVLATIVFDISLTPSGSPIPVSLAGIVATDATAALLNSSGSPGAITLPGETPGGGVPLAPGLTLNPLTGELTGIPAQAGTFCTKYQVMDSLGQTATATCCVTISAGVLIYVLNYRELDTAAQIAAAMPIHTSLSGKLVSTDHLRKWTRWNIPAVAGALMYREAGKTQPVFLYGENAYTLDAAKLTDDDLGQIYPYYTTYFFVTHDLEGQLTHVDPKGQKTPLGSGRKLLAYLKAYIAAQAAQTPGTCRITITPFVDSLQNPWALVGVRTLINTPKFDLEWGGGMAQGDRIALQFASSPISGTDNGFTLQRLTAFLKRAQRLQIRGAAQ